MSTSRTVSLNLEFFLSVLQKSTISYRLEMIGLVVSMLSRRHKSNSSNAQGHSVLFVGLRSGRETVVSWDPIKSKIWSRTMWCTKNYHRAIRWTLSKLRGPGKLFCYAYYCGKQNESSISMKIDPRVSSRGVSRVHQLSLYNPVPRFRLLYCERMWSNCIKT